MNLSIVHENGLQTIDIHNTTITARSLDNYRLRLDPVPRDKEIVLNGDKEAVIEYDDPTVDLASLFNQPNISPGGAYHKSSLRITVYSDIDIRDVKIKLEDTDDDTVVSENSLFR